MTSLQELSLSKNAITDVGAAHLATLVSLVYLDITNNKLTGSAAQFIKCLHKLSNLYLMSNQVALPGVETLIL